ncbi:hypothetical protein P3T43_001569 [Paraburkholderia sp. GAS41]|jgi:hypothetical protein
MQEETRPQASMAEMFGAHSTFHCSNFEGRSDRKRTGFGAERVNAFASGFRMLSQDYFLKPYIRYY